MQITIKGRVAAKLKSDVAEFGEIVTGGGVDWEERTKRHREYDDLDLELSRFTNAECHKLADLLTRSGVAGTKVIAADVRKYLRAATEGLDGMAARTVRQAAWMLEHHVATNLPHYLVFSEDDYEGGSYVGYYVSDVMYQPEARHASSRKPEHVEIKLVYVDCDNRKTNKVELFAQHVIGKNVTEILAAAGYVAETPTLWQKLGEETERYYQRRDQVGKKYTARGLAACDVDDATGRDAGKLRSWSRNGYTLRMDTFGIETPVVVDVLSENGDKQDRDRGRDVNMYRWHKMNLRYFAPAEDDLSRHLEADEDSEFQPEIQVPVHPLVPVFDLKRHVRVRVHLNNLTEYAYRTEVASGLVIPERDRKLIDLLVDQSSNTFQDVVSGKGSSMNILSGGRPGTGKTLTAEVFAEFKQRPLYTVQCSQLGLDPVEIEKALLVVLQRANRWNAILLLDEADVYIRERGTDLEHNAIVGVFLRVLEYAQCILFMTTNLADAVDDAIASRCIVKIGYEYPEPAAQAQIWRKLADLNSITLGDETIAEFVAAHPKISGRDVKNLLKLASFVAARDGKPVTIDVLEFALQYKPTAVAS